MWNLLFHRCCLLSLADFTFLFEPEHVFADFSASAAEYNIFVGVSVRIWTQ